MCRPCPMPIQTATARCRKRIPHDQGPMNTQGDNSAKATMDVQREATQLWLHSMHPKTNGSHYTNTQSAKPANHRQWHRPPRQLGLRGNTTSNKGGACHRCMATTRPTLVPKTARCKWGGGHWGHEGAKGRQVHFEAKPRIAKRWNPYKTIDAGSGRNSCRPASGNGRHATVATHRRATLCICSQSGTEHPDFEYAHRLRTVAH